MDVWSNEDMSFGEKMITTFSTLAVVVGTLTAAFDKDTRSKVLNTVQTLISNSAEKDGVLAKVAATLASKGKKTATQGETKATIA
jgi:hypothetical protein